MKKKDIMNLIKANETIKNNNDLLSTIKILNDDLYEDEKYWYPNTQEFNEYFDVLKKEMIETKDETSKAKGIKRKTKCNHQVRLKYSHIFGSDYICVLCGNKESNVEYFNSSKYRHNYTVTFDAKEQEDDDGPYIVETGKTYEEVFEIILKILEKYNDEDEVDLVQEFSKLNFEHVEINTESRKEENYILIIGGTNKEYIDEENNVFISKKYKLKSIDFAKYFTSLLNTKVAVIDNKEVITNNKYNKLKEKIGSSNLLLEDYTSLGYLETALYQVKDIDFKIIIDLSELYDYKIKDSKVKTKKHDLNLKERFPNSTIVKIDNLDDKKSLEEIKSILIKSEELLLLKQKEYGDDKYYYLNDDKVENTDIEGSCSKIKMLLRKY